MKAALHFEVLLVLLHVVEVDVDATRWQPCWISKQVMQKQVIFWQMASPIWDTEIYTPEN